MSKPVKFNIPIYGGELWVIFSDDVIKSGKKINMHFEKDANDCNGISFTKSDKHGPGIYCVIIKTKKIRPDIIAHEAVHLANYVFSERGVVINTKDDEHLAYFIGWIVMNIVYAAKIKKMKLSIRLSGPHDQVLNYGKKIKC